MNSFLLIYPPGDKDDVMNDVPPLGLLAISSYMEENCKGIHAPIYNFISSTLDEVKKTLLEIRWDEVLVVGITVMSSYVSSACKVAQIIRTISPEVIILAGGPHITLTGVQFLHRHLEFDGLVIGDGEEPMAKFALNILEGNTEQKIDGIITRTTVIESKKATVQILPPSQWSNPFEANLQYGFLRQPVYTDTNGVTHPAVALVTSRGCPLACSFCSIIAMNSKYRSLPPNIVIPWLLKEREKRYFEHIYFLDADFLISKSRSSSWGDALYDAFQGTVTWSVQANVGHILALGFDLLCQLKNDGLVFAELGFEAGNDKQFRFFNKTNFGKIADVKQSYEAISLLKRSGIGIGIDYIMFYPELTIKELAQNLKFFVEGSLMDTFDNGHYFNELMLFPGTPLRLFYEEKQNKSFDIDEVPSVRKFYIDKSVLRIRDIYLDWYRRIYDHQVVSQRMKLLEESLICNDVKRKAKFRLMELKLRHQPYRILKALIESNGNSEIIENLISSDELLFRNIMNKVS